MQAEHIKIISFCWISWISFQGKTVNCTLPAIMSNLLFLVPFYFFYLCSSLSVSLSVAWMWPSLWYPGKPACFHDNVCRQNSVFVLSWIKSQTSFIPFRHTHTHTLTHTYTHKHMYIHHGRYAPISAPYCNVLMLNAPTQTNDDAHHTHTHLMKPSYSRLLTNNNSIKTSFHKGNVMGF